MSNSFGHFDCTVRYKPEVDVLIGDDESVQIDSVGGIPTAYRVLNKAGFVRLHGCMVMDASPHNTRPEQP